MRSFSRIRGRVLASVIVAALAAPPVTVAAPVGGDPVIVRSTGAVGATFLGGAAAFSVDLYLESPVNGLGVLFNNQTTPAGTQRDLGTFAAGTELIFRIHVNDTGDDFFTGPALRNPDGIYHAVVDPEYGVETTLVGFEDQFSGGDRDFDDLQFAFTNTTAPPDADGDGVPDADETGDANGDGIPDAFQAAVAKVAALQTYPSQETLGEQVIVVADRTQLEAYLRDFEAAMRSTGDDAELQNVDLQNSLQKQQQTLQLMSNVSKMLHDTAMGVIRKIGGLQSAHAGSGDDEIMVIALRFPPGVSANTYVNFGPTPDDPLAHAYEFLFDGTTGAQFVPGGVLLHFVDGQRGDHDLTLNGIVTTEGGGVLVGAQATRTVGYWKNHRAAWPLASLVLGDETYRQDELLQLLAIRTAGDASLTLAGQLIAAKLNVAQGSPEETISGTIEEADLLLRAFEGKLPYGVTKASPARRDMLTLAKLLEAYNSGL